MLRIGVDVGGTNTDAALMDGPTVVASAKVTTTEDRIDGIRDALRAVLHSRPPDEPVMAVMIGTTRFVNAVVERKDLGRAAALRICLPASASLPPFVDWPTDLRERVSAGVDLVAGGHEVDGRPIAPLDERAIADVARRLRKQAVPALAISAVFAPLDPSLEERAAEIVHDIYPELHITCSHALGRIGLLERENAALLNASLMSLADATTAALVQAVRDAGLDCPVYMTQNDGTIAATDVARAFPVLSFACGPTNSMRGAAFLSGVQDAIVCDIGGTTTDVGALQHGFPRIANNVVTVGGVRTLFRMPDLESIGLGGGSVVDPDTLDVGPASVGYQLRERARVFGGDVLTATDIAVAAGLADIGDERLVASLDDGTIAAARARMHARIARSVDQMKPDARALPLLAVGGGAMLAPQTVDGISEVITCAHHDVANAVGAAIAQVSGEVDQVFHDMDRDAALAEAEAVARNRAVANGAEPASVHVVDREDLPLAYLPGNALRVRVRVVGALGASDGL